MISRKTYSNLINQENPLNASEESNVIEAEDFFKNAKKYTGYVPYTAEEASNQYEKQIAFLESLSANDRNENQEKAVQRGDKIFSIIPKIEERRKKEELESENVLKLTRSKQKRAGYTNASVIIFVVLNLGFLLAALLLSLK